MPGCSPAPLSAAQAAALARAPGVRSAMPVASFPQTATGVQTLAVDAAQATNVVLLRPDQSALAEPVLFGKIRPAGGPGGATAAAAGVMLPDRTAGSTCSPGSARPPSAWLRPRSRCPSRTPTGTFSSSTRAPCPRTARFTPWPSA